MNSYRNSDEVCEGLGEKVLEALGSAIPRTRLDLERYRTSLPDIVATSSSRGLANWFHDRVWHHLVSDLQDLDNVVIVDKGPVREIVVDGTYRVRIKRHDRRGRVSTYPTQTALEFLSQPSEQLVLDGLAQNTSDRGIPVELNDPRDRSCGSVAARWLGQCALAD